MTKLASFDENQDFIYSSQSDLIQPSMTTSEQIYPADNDYHSSFPASGRLFKIYNEIFSPVYVYYLTISTSYVYTDTTTFFITNCIPQPFSYSICRTVGWKEVISPILVIYILPLCEPFFFFTYAVFWSQKPAYCRPYT